MDIYRFIQPHKTQAAPPSNNLFFHPFSAKPARAEKDSPEQEICAHCQYNPFRPEAQRERQKVSGTISWLYGFFFTLELLRKLLEYRFGGILVYFIVTGNGGFLVSSGLTRQQSWRIHYVMCKLS
jgi:hypothetical protein